jgi:uncharacterized protein (UPF0548 family)
MRHRPRRAILDGKQRSPTVEIGRRMGLFRTVTPERLAGASFTYAEVGATRHPPLPAGYTHTEKRAVVGVGRPAWERAVEALFDWRAQRGAALRVRAGGPASAPGTVVVLTVGLPRLGYDIPCRVVWSLTEGPERGFAYGTLPGHPVTTPERTRRPGGSVAGSGPLRRRDPPSRSWPIGHWLNGGRPPTGRRSAASL